MNESLPQTEAPDSGVAAIAMWDFSWLERRWPGAGYEDWDVALDELVDRGYNAVRIDAYPHLILSDPLGLHELRPVWSVNDWGAPMLCRVQVMPALTRFIAACGRRGVKVALSSWFRRDTRQSWRKLCTPMQHAIAWIRTLECIEEAGLLPHILYVDLCNEWPQQIWAPFFYGRDREMLDPEDGKEMSASWESSASLAWLKEASAVFRSSYPSVPLTTSVLPFEGPLELLSEMVDFFEPHLWMVQDEFYQRLGYRFEHSFDYIEYERVQRNARDLYFADETYWQKNLLDMITRAAAVSRSLRKPLITTECWGVIDYKDGPLLDWDWVKSLCALGVEKASATGCWSAIATSNFCGPQFVGMWRDIDWHRHLTSKIKSSSCVYPT